MTRSSPVLTAFLVAAYEWAAAVLRVAGFFEARFFINSSFSLIRVLTSLFTREADNGLVCVKRIVPFEV